MLSCCRTSDAEEPSSAAAYQQLELYPPAPHPRQQQQQQQQYEQLSEAGPRNHDRGLYRVAERERAFLFKLLVSMVPPRIAEDLSNGVHVPAQMFQYVVIFFSDIEGFVAYADRKSPMQVFDMLDGLFSVMDYCVSHFSKKLYKVETIGDAFVVVAGILDEPRDSQSVRETAKANISDTHAMCEFALLVNLAVQKMSLGKGKPMRIRIGLHNGPAVTGLTGKLTQRFCIFGDSVNTAHRMESTGESGKVHISQSLKLFIEAAPISEAYSLTPRASKTFVKGKGAMDTFFLHPAADRSIEIDYATELAHIDSMVAALVVVATADEAGGAILGRDASFNSLNTQPTSSHDTQHAIAVESISESDRAGLKAFLSKGIRPFMRNQSDMTVDTQAPVDNDNQVLAIQARHTALEMRVDDAMRAKAMLSLSVDEARELLSDSAARARKLSVANRARADHLLTAQLSTANLLELGVAEEIAELEKTGSPDVADFRFLKHRLADELRYEQSETSEVLRRKNEAKAALLSTENECLAALLMESNARIADSLEKHNASTALALASLLKVASIDEGEDYTIGADDYLVNASSEFDDNFLLPSAERRESEALRLKDSLAAAAMALDDNRRLVALELAKKESLRRSLALITEEGVAEESAADGARRAAADRSTAYSLSRSRSSIDTSSRLEDKANDAPKSSSYSTPSLNSLATLSYTEADRVADFDRPAIPLAPLMDPNFDLLAMILPRQTFAITGSILTLTEGMVGDVSGPEVGVPLQVWYSFLWKVGQNYRQTAYHTYHHALCVAQYCAILLSKSGAMLKLSAKERFLLMVAAVIHDVDHLGLNNAYHVNSGSKLAHAHNDQSVCENHHLSVAFRIMRDPSYDIFATWSDHDQKKARKSLIKMVLSTDMAFHGSLSEMLKGRSAKAVPFDFALESDRLDFCSVVLHAADLSNTVRPFAQARPLATLLAAEFNIQAAREAEEGLPVQPHMVQLTAADVCRGELNFLKFILPWKENLVACFPLLAPLMTAHNLNIACWTEALLEGSPAV